MRKQYSKELKSKLIAEWLSSGLSKNQFSKIHNIPTPSFCNWTKSYPNGGSIEKQNTSQLSFTEIRPPITPQNINSVSPIKISITASNGTKVEFEI